MFNNWFLVINFETFIKVVLLKGFCFLGEFLLVGDWCSWIFFKSLSFFRLFVHLFVPHFLIKRLIFLNFLCCRSFRFLRFTFPQFHETWFLRGWSSHHLGLIRSRSGFIRRILRLFQIQSLIERLVVSD